MKNASSKKDHYEKAEAIANSAAGQELLKLLESEQDQDVQAAIKKAQSGDLSDIQLIVNKLLHSPKTEHLINEMRGSK